MESTVSTLRHAPQSLRLVPCALRPSHYFFIAPVAPQAVHFIGRGLWPVSCTSNITWHLGQRMSFFLPAGLTGIVVGA